MGIFDSVVGALNSGGAAPGANPQSAAIVTEVLSMLRGQGGASSLSGLLQAFENGGLGHLFQSWVGSGQNLPVSPNQIQSVLGNSGMLERIAQATGMQTTDVAAHLSQVLPQIVDHLTPNGQNHPGDVSGALEGLAQRFLHR